MNNIDNLKLKRWTPLLIENGIDVNNPVFADRVKMLIEAAESASANLGKLYENTSYGNQLQAYSSAAMNGGHHFATPGNVNGLGAITPAQPGATPGRYGTPGSVDVPTVVLPIGFKVMAKTIGLDLVTMVNISAPSTVHVLMDYKHSTGNTNDSNEFPSVFKLSVNGSAGKRNLRSFFQTMVYYFGLKQREGFVTKGQTSASRAFFYFVSETFGSGSTSVGYLGSNSTSTGNTSYNTSNSTTTTDPTLYAPNQWFDSAEKFAMEPTIGNRKGALEFLGFGRIDKEPILRAFVAPQTISNRYMQKDGNQTFLSGLTIESSLEDAILKFELASGTQFAADYEEINNEWYAGFELYAQNDSANDTAYEFLTQNAVHELSLSQLDVVVKEVSANEDFIPGFVSNWNKTAGMPRQESERRRPQSLNPDPVTYNIQTGDIEIEAVLKKTVIEDIKAATGRDVIADTEGQLINYLSQQLSNDIVENIYELGWKNNAESAKDSDGNSVYDFDIPEYLTAMTGQGESGMSLGRKVWNKILRGSYYILKEGRIGKATYAITNIKIASVLAQVTNYVQYPPTKFALEDGLMPQGTLDGITIYVDPYSSDSEDFVVLGRKSAIDEPGLLFFNYLMAQSVSIITESTMSPKMLIRSRYAVAPVGFYPHKQFLAIRINDPKNVLS